MAKVVEWKKLASTIVSLIDDTLFQTTSLFMNEQILPVINDYDLVQKTSIRTYMATTWLDKDQYD